ncbi:MAG: tRNA lysidine(34) synthetase TilS [Methyloceanibacter sp.]
MAAPLSLGEAREVFDPLARYPRLALAVSGGPDSLAALHLLARWRVEGGAKLDVTVLTVDHGLRLSSREEALMVARMAASLGLSHAILTWSHAEGEKGGVQARAREARYDLMAAYCHAHDIPALVTAHHLDDQAETFLMRLKRGSGLDGLAAIPEVSSLAGIAVLRPLLDVPKARLAATLTEAGIGWAEDPSNVDPRFERARLRASCDALAQLGLTSEALARSALRLRRARVALDAAASDFLGAHGDMSEAGYCLLGRAALAAAPTEIALRALARAVTAVGGRPAPLRLAKLEVLLAALQENPGKTHTLGGCRLQPIGDRLGVFRETRGARLPGLHLAPGARALWDNRFRVELAPSEAKPVTVRALGESGFRDLSSSSPWLAALPRHAGTTLPGGWRAGEMICLPHLGISTSSVGFSASFVNAAWLGAQGVTLATHR